MSFDFLSFLMAPAFVLPWYGFGLFAAGAVLVDTLFVNPHVNQPLKAGWLIVIVFFSVIGLLLYLWTCRPPKIQDKRGEENKQAHHRYVDSKWRKVMGSTIHCVAGDGLGIMTAMVIARLLDVPFWTEFGFEYAVGFVFGWLIFQAWAMLEHGNSLPQALWKGGRAEFFSMITVMVGMGLVMRFVTPEIVAHPPDPDMAGFWGFGAFGLLVGAVFTYPMNWWLVSIGWKHGMT